ncbi:unnamed protein product [Peniophora sp. CBMAI 1063]|nr:unnamed protein product [Peniophora sp. CBMAI 1063]
MDSEDWDGEPAMLYQYIHALSPTSGLLDMAHFCASLHSCSTQDEGILSDAVVCTTVADGVGFRHAPSHRVDSSASSPLVSKPLLVSLFACHSHSCACLPVTCLIDNSSQVGVLIRPSMAHTLGVPKEQWGKLEWPLRARGAFSSTVSSSTSVPSPDMPSTSLPSMTCSCYLNLSFESSNELFSFAHMRWVIGPESLCAPVILGQQFLAENRLVCDAKDRAIWSKITSYDLIHPDAPSRLPYRYSADNITKQNATFHALYDAHIARLGAALLPQQEPLAPHTTTEYILSDSIPDIDDLIQYRACLSHLEWLDTQFKAKHASVFGPIPHASNLPIDVLHCIDLKDTSATIRRCAYHTPKQYKAAFNTLLAENITSIRIQPSTLHFVSPSFLVNKPNGYKHLVIDHRQLNNNTVPDHFPMPLVDEILCDCVLGHIWGKLDMTATFHQTRTDLDLHQYYGVRERQASDISRERPIDQWASLFVQGTHVTSTLLSVPFPAPAELPTSRKCYLPLVR